MKHKAFAKCNIHGCKSEVLSRGLCSSHYKQYYRLVKLGETTWAELEELGVVSVMRRGRPPTALMHLQRKRRG